MTAANASVRDVVILSYVTLTDVLGVVTFFARIDTPAGQTLVAVAAVKAPPATRDSNNPNVTAAAMNAAELVAIPSGAVQELGPVSIKCPRGANPNQDIAIAGAVANAYASNQQSIANGLPIAGVSTSVQGAYSIGGRYTLSDGSNVAPAVPGGKTVKFGTTTDPNLAVLV